MKEQLLNHIHQALDLQLNELTAYYEQELTKLKRENGTLLTKVHKLEKQLAALQQETTPPKQAVTKPVIVKEKQQLAVTKSPTTEVAKPLPQIAPAKVRKKTSKIAHTFSLHNFHIIQEADLKLFCDEYNLQEREITVALFDLEGVEEIDKTAQLRAYVNEEQSEAFILENAFKAERQKYKPYRLLGSRKYYTVDWATNHLLQKEGSLKRYLNFGPDSELVDFGYQVRTLKKEERWAILNNAVPIIGLQKAVETIAGHVQQRLAEENGATFYAKPIVKWKNDLLYLKKNYYNDEFIWPKI